VGSRRTDTLLCPTAPEVSQLPDNLWYNHPIPNVMPRRGLWC
jgi:hypothetical protein